MISITAQVLCNPMNCHLPGMATITEMLTLWAVQSIPHATTTIIYTISGS